jgi:hypothetical protein
MSRPIEDKGIGYVTLPNDIKTDAGKLTEQTALYLSQKLREFAQTMNNLSAGDGSHRSKTGNHDGQWQTILTPSVSDTEFPVDHGLGRLPVSVLPCINDSYGVLKASNQAAWTSERIYLKCNVASATIRIRLE